MQRRELEYVSGTFDTLELNGPFYSLQRPSSYARWRDRTPDGFVFAVKGSRFITHRKKLAGVDEALAAFFASGVLDLGDKLGPVLWQLPPMLGYREERMAGFLGSLPRTVGAATRLAEKGYRGSMAAGSWLLGRRWATTSPAFARSEKRGARSETRLNRQP